MKFRKKPVVVEAYQWLIGDTTNIEGVCEKAHDGHYGGPHIHTLEGTLSISHGDWIIKGVKGEFYPCKPAIFEATYELVGDKEKQTENISSPEITVERMEDIAESFNLTYSKDWVGKKTYVHLEVVDVDWDESFKKCFLLTINNRTAHFSPNFDFIGT